MYTQCPECRTQHTISVQTLRESRGMMRCSECSALFDALPFLSEQPNDEVAAPKQSEPLAESQQQGPRPTKLWIFGSGIGLIILLVQLIYFEGTSISRHPSVRPWLKKMCQELGCRLPDYRNLDEISILQGSLTADGTHGYRFKVVVVNQADFPQPYPSVRLILLNYTGERFAERVFSQGDYQTTSATLRTGESGEIILDIAAPDTKIGGYNFHLL